MVNKNMLTARLERLHDYLNILKSVQQYDSTRFINDPFIYGTAERNLHLAIECLLDIGNHIIADRGYEKPESYADIFNILHQHLVIQYQLYKNLEGMAAFRNVLVHDYMRLDRARVYQTIQNKTQYLEELGAIFADMLL
ncbi:type VII toxin-antitoxin system HepT family RNase toxin [Desulfocastanea catecholica]